jgi:hypothetical protein
MGLFDGGGLDLESIMQMINPVGSAQAATAAQPGGGIGGMTPQSLINSEAGRNPINQNTPFPVVPPEGQPYDPVGSPSLPRSVTPITQPSIAAPQPNEPALPAPKPTLDDLAVEQAVRPGAVGASLTGGTTGGTSGATDISAQSRTEPRRPNLAEALKGTAMPKQPELQKISTPAAPRPTGTIKSGELMALLTALNAGGGRPVLGR